MTPEEWTRLQALFEAVSEARPEERDAALQKAEAELGDERLRAELRRLLEHAEPEEGFLRPFFRPPEPVQVGDLIGGRFRILRGLGRGGMGEVFEAVDERLDERVAIKIVRPSGAPEDRTLARLNREVQVARKVSHPNVCRVHDVGEHQGSLFLSMELVEGETLAQRLERGALTLEEWDSVARQLLDGLQSAHAAGVVHRDLKPSNIMLHGDRVVILDFGLARSAMGEEDGSLTQTGTVVGTLDWMAPEQLRGEWDARSDLYSAALVLLYALTGSRPEMAGDGLAGALRRATGKFDFSNLLPARLAASRRYFLLRSLERDPAQRFQTAADARKYLGERLRILPRLRTWSRKTKLGIALGATLLVSLFLAGMRYIRYPTLREGSTILIAATMNVTGEHQFDGVTPLLRASIGQSTRVNLWNQSRLPVVLRSMRRSPDTEPPAPVWREIAFREHAPLLLFSTVSPSGTGYTLTIRCEQIGASPDAPGRAWDHTIHANGPAALFEAVRDAGTWVRETAGEQASDIAAFNRLPQDITSASWEALELFGRAEAMYASERLPEAVPVLQRAIQIDPQFTMAIMRLGDVLTALNRGQEGMVYWRQAIARPNLQHVSEHERLNIESRYAFDAGDLAAAEPVAREMVRKFPHDQAAALLFAAVLGGLGRTSEGTDIAQSVQKRFGPSLLGSSIILRGLADRGQFQAMESQFKLTEAISPTWTMWIRGVAGAAQQQYSAAASFFAELAKAGGEQASRAATLMAALEADQGNVDGAIAVLRPAVDRDRQSGAAGFAARKSVVLGFLEGQKGAKERARALVLEALSGTSSPQIVAEGVTVLARNGYTADAVRAMKRMPAGSGLVYEAAKLRMQGEILAAKGDYPGAVETLERAAQSRAGRHSKEYLARALHLAGQRERAAMLYREIVDRPWSIWNSPETEWPGTIFQAREYLKSYGEGKQ